MNRHTLQSKLSTTAIGVLVSLLIYGSALTNALGATSIYIAQAAQGSNNGSSCANARPASWFNTSSNWGTGATQISPGSTVFLCGTITTDLTFQGNGTNGNYITVDGTGATYGGEFNTNNKSWWKVQDVTYASGSGGMITITGGSNGIFTGNYADNTTGGVFLAQAGGTTRPDIITISNNFIRTTTANLGSSVQTDIIVTEGSTNVIIEGNYLEMRAGGSGGGSQHDDCIQTWEKGGSSGGPPGNWTIRYNEIVMNSPSANDRSWLMLENLTGTINIHDNVFLGLQGAGSANGMAADANASSVVFNIYNNTIVAKNSASNNIFNLVAPGTANLRNNIVHTQNQLALTGSMTVNRDHNLWFGSNIPACKGTGEICGKDPLFTNYAANDFSLLPNSPAASAGVNLGSPYDKFIAAGSSWPGPTLGQRSTSGNWSLSAFDPSATSTALVAPSNLKVTQ